MHDLSPNATLLYASDSIEDVLGYLPEEVIGKSCFDYFHPKELPFARDKHGESIQFDNAAVLAYCKYVCSPSYLFIELTTTQSET